jgi:uncharacterized protein
MCPLLPWLLAAVSATFPPPDERRAPDLTLPDTAARLVTYNADGRAAISAGPDHVLSVWQARTGEQCTGERLRRLVGHRAAIRAVEARPDGTAISLDDDGAMRWWNLESGALLQSRPLHVATSVTAFRPGRPQVAYAAGRRIRVRSYEEEDRVTATFAAEKTPIAKLAFSPDGKRLVSGTATGVVRVWDVDRRVALRSFELGAPVRALAASATHVLVGGDSALALSSLDTDASPRTFGPRPGRVGAVAFSTKGDQFAAANDEGAIEVWDTATGEHLCTQAGHEGGVVSLAFSPNGQKMASAGEDGTIRYWTVPLPPVAPNDLERITAALPARAAATPRHPRRLLVFWRADAILHKGGAAAANHAIELMGAKTGAYESDFSRDYAALDPAVLARYDAIVLNNTAHLAISEAAKKSLLEFAQNGGGVIGIHAAIDTFKGWPEGTEIVGATFAGHPWPPTGSWAIKIEEPAHPLNRAWSGRGFSMHDEVYELGDPYRRSDRRVLLSLDLSDAATAGVTPLHRVDRDFAVSWIKRFGRGRVFFAMFGHLGEPFQIPAVLQFYLDGIQYALGDLDVDDAPIAGAAETRK